MKASKFIVLAGGVLGILAFFLPLVTVTHQGTELSVSTFQLVKGLDAVQSAVQSEDVKAATASAGAEERRALRQADSDLGAIKGIAIGIFVPAALLALIGGLAVRRKQFGRLGGTFALLLGLATLGVGAMLQSAAEGEGGIGITVLLVTGAAGFLGGLLGLIKPERPAPGLARA